MNLDHWILVIELSNEDVTLELNQAAGESHDNGREGGQKKRECWATQRVCRTGQWVSMVWSSTFLKSKNLHQMFYSDAEYFTLHDMCHEDLNFQQNNDF